MKTFKRLPAVNCSFLLFLLFCLFSYPYLAAAQTLTTGQVLGQITDPSGAVVPQSKIELRDNATGALRSTNADAAGQYAFAQVAPGLYSITVSASGFAKTVAPSVKVEVGKTVTINMSLSLGKPTEVVEVQPIRIFRPLCVDVRAQVLQRIAPRPFADREAIKPHHVRRDVPRDRAQQSLRIAGHVLHWGIALSFSAMGDVIDLDARSPGQLRCPVTWPIAQVPLVVASEYLCAATPSATTA